MEYQQNIINYIIEASIEPILICDKDNLRGINEPFVNKLGYQDVDSILSQSFQEFINIHFHTNNDVTTSDAIRIEEISHCNIVSQCLKQTAPVKMKKFNIDESEYYSISIGKCGICDSIQRNLNNEDGLIKLEERIIRELSLIFETLPCMLLYSDSSGMPILVNRNYQKFLKLTDKEDLIICIHPSEVQQYKEEWTKHVDDQIPFSMFIKLRGHPDRSTENNKYKLHVIKSIPIMNGILGKANRWITTITDIHDMKEIEAEKQRLIASEKLAIEENIMKSEFIAIMSHELRTPLFGVIGYTNLLLQGELNDSQKEILENIDRSSHLLLTVIQDILEFSRIEAGNMTIKPHDFYLCNLFKDIEHTMNIQAKKKKLDLIVDIPEFDYKIIGDSCRLLQIMINLTSNAIKFTNKGSVNIRLDFNILGDTDIELIFRVIDSGIGISKKGQIKLFNKWSQIENESVKKFEGSGLGLFICNSLVSLMNGNIGIISQPDIGTEVWVKIKLPYIKDLNNKAENFLEITTKLETERNTNKIYKILIGEDNETNQKIITKFLEKIGNFEINLYDNGKLALTQFLLLPKEHYDLIILDQLMPEMNGDAACQAIRNINTILPIISASANPNTIENLIQIGYTDSIPKPFTFAQFKSIIQKYLPGV